MVDPAAAGGPAARDGSAMSEDLKTGLRDMGAAGYPGGVSGGVGPAGSRSPQERTGLLPGRGRKRDQVRAGTGARRRLPARHARPAAQVRPGAGRSGRGRAPAGGDPGRRGGTEEGTAGDRRRGLGPRVRRRFGGAQEPAPDRTWAVCRTPGPGDAVLWGGARRGRARRRGRRGPGSGTARRGRTGARRLDAGARSPGRRRRTSRRGGARGRGGAGHRPRGGGAGRPRRAGGPTAASTAPWCGCGTWPARKTGAGRGRQAIASSRTWRSTRVPA